MSMDGLAALQAKREKATSSARHVPPPRHASKKTNAPRGAADEPQQTTKPTASASKPATQKAEPSAAPVRTPERKKPSATEAAPAPLVRATIYLQEADDTWLEGIAADGRARRPRVDASRSAVTRLALERLREHMTEAEIVAHLAAKAQASGQTTGRKRL